jgi:uncharacterized membrane protein
MATQAAVRDTGPRSARRGRGGNGAQSYGGRQQWQASGAEAQGDERLANFLGWFSIGLGLAQIVAPGGVARLIGVTDDSESRRLMRSVGVREITAGVGILSKPRPAGWVWTRVAGDMMDLAMLGKAMSSDENDRGRVAAATAAVLGVTALDVLCGRQLSQRSGEDGQSGVSGKAKDAIHIKRAITVNRPLEEVYAFWRDFENLALFMDHLESVQTTSERRSRWKAKAPAGVTIEWEAEIIEERPNEIIVWRSLAGADVDNAGSVRFRKAPGDRGTEIILDVEYSPPGGVIASKIAKLFSELPKTQMGNDLRRFKQVIETGEVVQSDASIHKGPHPARPPEFPVTV